MSEIDEYIKEVVNKGDEGSALLAEICSPTLRNSPYVDVVREGMNGLAVLRLPKDKLVVAHSLGGNPKIENTKLYAESLVDKLLNGSESIGATPVAFANVIDAREINLELVESIGNSLAKRAEHFKLAILNGELAGLGERVTVPANISGTMISIISKDSRNPGVFTNDEITYAVFGHEGKPIYINSDGVGTKTEFAERSGNLHLPLIDSLAMKVDDAIKFGAEVRVVSDVVETNGFNPMEKFKRTISKIEDAFGFNYIIQRENVRGRIRGYKEGVNSINLSGSAVSVIDESILRNLPKPSAGDYLIAIRGRPNPRSNGITDKRKIMIEMLGEEWHETKEGKMFLEFLEEPSTVFYNVFKCLREKNLATGFYHMSGGAFDGKLAKPLAKNNLFVNIKNLFPADWREYAIAGRRLTPAEIAYAKWPMGNDGFVTTPAPEKAICFIMESGLECRIVGQLEQAKNGKTGVELAGIKSSNGGDVYYTGKK